MCSSPKVPKTEQKDPVYLQNPHLDGLAITKNTGRNSLRVDRTGTNSLAVPTQQTSLAIPTTGGGRRPNA